MRTKASFPKETATTSASGAPKSAKTRKSSTLTVVTAMHMYRKIVNKIAISRAFEVVFSASFVSWDNRTISSKPRNTKKSVPKPQRLLPDSEFQDNLPFQGKENLCK